MAGVGPCCNTVCLFPCPPMETGSSSCVRQIPRFIGNHHRFVCFPLSSIITGWDGYDEASVTRYCSVRRRCVAGVAVDICATRLYEFMPRERILFGNPSGGRNRVFRGQLIFRNWNFNWGGNETILAFSLFLGSARCLIIAANKLIWMRQ